MKSRINLLSFLIATLIITLSCSKSKSLPIPGRPIEPLSPYLIEREFFPGQAWMKTATGYEMKLYTLGLTDSAINKGIKVSVAIYSGWSAYERLPFTVDEPLWFTDTINLSYRATPGKLQLFAKTSVNITWPSDVFIQY